MIEQVLNVSQEEMHDWFSTKREQELPSVLRLDVSSLQSMVRMADTHRAFFGNQVLTVSSGTESLRRAGALACTV